MQRKLMITVTSILLHFFVLAQTKPCSCFLVKETKGVIRIEKEVIENNNVQVFNDPDILTPVFSLGQGMNGDMVQKERRGGMIIAQCKDNLLKLKVRSPDGTEKPLPDMNVAELKGLNIRMNIVGGDGTKKAFLIEHYETIQEDKGPVIDMFGGKVPVRPGDYIITTETKKPASTSSVTGKVAFKDTNGWMVAPLSINGGPKMNFIIDMAATSSIIDKKFLAPNTTIHKMEMVEYSAGGSQQKEASTQGATGSTAKDVLAGKAEVQDLLLGNIALKDISFTVLNKFPAKLGDLGIAGIIGSDLLMKPGLLTIRREKNGGWLEFGPAVPARGSKIPFSMAGGLLFGEGTLSNKPVLFLFDTGARESILNRSFAEKYGLQFPVVQTGKKISGIDDNPVTVSVVKVPVFRLGDHAYKNRNMIFGDIAALASIGLADNSVILGMDFFRQYKTVQFNFTGHYLVLAI